MALGSPGSDPSDFAAAGLLCFPMCPIRFRSRKNYIEFVRQVAENDSPEESLDVFLTDTYLCKNCVRNRTVVQWICTISPSGDPPGRKVLGNVIVFLHSGNNQGFILKDLWKHCVSNISLAWWGEGEQKYDELHYFQSFHEMALGIPGSDPSDSADAIFALFCYVSGTFPVNGKLTCIH